MTKLHQDEQYLRKVFENQDITSKDLAKELHVSYKLIELYLEKYNIPFKSQRPTEG